MGWCRNYHVFYFQRFSVRKIVEREYQFPAIGPTYGPIDAHSIDMMHAGTHGITFVDSKKTFVDKLLLQIYFKR